MCAYGYVVCTFACVCAHTNRCTQTCVRMDIYDACKRGCTSVCSSILSKASDTIPSDTRVCTRVRLTKKAFLFKSSIISGNESLIPPHAPSVARCPDACRVPPRNPNPRSVGSLAVADPSARLQRELQREMVRVFGKPGSRRPERDVPFPFCVGENSGLASRVLCLRLPLARRMQSAAESRCHGSLKSSHLDAPVHVSTFIGCLTGEQVGFLGNPHAHAHAHTCTEHTLFACGTRSQASPGISDDRTDTEA